jgi:hypothetical protein
MRNRAKQLLRVIASPISRVPYFGAFRMSCGQVPEAGCLFCSYEHCHNYQLRALKRACAGWSLLLEDLKFERGKFLYYFEMHVN